MEVSNFWLTKKCSENQEMLGWWLVEISMADGIFRVCTLPRFHHLHQTFNRINPISMPPLSPYLHFLSTQVSLWVFYLIMMFSLISFQKLKCYAQSFKKNSLLNNIDMVKFIYFARYFSLQLEVELQYIHVNLHFLLFFCLLHVQNTQHPLDFF